MTKSKPATRAKSRSPLVVVVDDDESVRESLPDLLRQYRFAARAFPSAEAYLESRYVNVTRCLILDVAMPGLSGPALMRELSNRRHKIPTIFITAIRDMALRDRLLAEGAIECLFKPFNVPTLIAAVKAVLSDG